MHYCTLIYSSVQYCTTTIHFIPYSTVHCNLHCTVQYFTALCCALLCFKVLNCTVVYSTKTVIYYIKKLDKKFSLGL